MCNVPFLLRSAQNVPGPQGSAGGRSREGEGEAGRDVKLGQRPAPSRWASHRGPGWTARASSPVDHPRQWHHGSPPGLARGWCAGRVLGLCGDPERVPSAGREGRGSRHSWSTRAARPQGGARGARGPRHPDGHPRSQRGPGGARPPRHPGQHGLPGTQRPRGQPGLPGPEGHQGQPGKHQQPAAAGLLGREAEPAGGRRQRGRLRHGHHQRGGPVPEPVGPVRVRRARLLLLHLPGGVQVGHLPVHQVHPEGPDRQLRGLLRRQQQGHLPGGVGGHRAAAPERGPGLDREGPGQGPHLPGPRCRQRLQRLPHLPVRLKQGGTPARLGPPCSPLCNPQPIRSASLVLRSALSRGGAVVVAGGQVIS